MKGKQSGFSLVELLIVVAIILIIAAIAVPNFMRSRMTANESSGAATIRTLVSDAIAYSNSYPQSGFPATISNLGGLSPCVPSAVTACLADQTLACAAQPCTRDNYQYSLTGIGVGGGIATDFVAFGTPAGQSLGTRDFCATADGAVRAQASANPPPSPAITTVAPCAVLTPL